jgi:threonine dehydrogenase-like Zn-dependent dehydrogenase
MDRVPSRLDFCRDNMGVEHTLLAGSGTEIEELEALTDGNRADVVVDATGSNHSMAKSLEYCAFKGRLVYVGITQAELALPHAPALHRRELDILASRNALAGDFTRIIQLIEDGDINTQPWITHRTSFDNMIGEFESFTRPETGVIKAVVEMG